MNSRSSRTEDIKIKYKPPINISKHTNILSQLTSPKLFYLSKKKEKQDEKIYNIYLECLQASLIFFFQNEKSLL